MVGLIPLFAVETLEPDLLGRCPISPPACKWLLKHRPELAASHLALGRAGFGERRLLSLLRGSRMKKLLRRMLDETEFLSDYGVRSLSRQHAENPFVFSCNGELERAVTSRPNRGRRSSEATRTGAGRSGCRSIT